MQGQEPGVPIVQAQEQYRNRDDQEENRIGGEHLIRQAPGEGAWLFGRPWLEDDVD